MLTRFRSQTFLTLFIGATLGAVLAFPVNAEAQWHGPYAPYGPYGPWGGPYPCCYYPYDAFNVSIKLEVQPKDAEVYVDGARAGEVDDFDGIFQRLRARPGTREIVIYKDGFRSVRQELYLEPFGDRKLRFDLEPLRPGEPPDARPTPRPESGEYRDRPMPPYGRPPRPEPEPQPQPQPEPKPEQAARFGTLSLRMQPADADVFVDGERWTSALENQRLAIQLIVGRHKVEVRKDGFVTYTEDVLIRDRATLTLNVALTKR